MSELKKAATIFICQDKKVLACSRKDNHNSFGLPGGKLELDETFEQAAIRELFEETGITAKDLKFVFERQDEEFIVRTFIPGTFSGKIKANPEEGTVRWVSFEEPCNGSFAEYNKNLLQHLNLL